MLRRKLHAAGNSTVKNSEQEHESDNKDSPHIKKRFLGRYLYAGAKIIFEQNYENVQSILLNFGIMAALLLSILIALIMTVPVEESARGDILALSHNSFRFRCHFASLNTSSTIELCSREHTMALFGTTNATIICKDGPGLLMTRIKVLARSDLTRLEDNILANAFHCNMWWHLNSQKLNPNLTSACSSSLAKTDFQVANSITNEAYMEFMAGELPTRDTTGMWFGAGWNAELPFYHGCRPSAGLSSAGFRSMFFLLVALFLDLYLIGSLSFSAAHRNESEMILWWSSGGVVGTIAVVVMILDGTINFIWAITAVVQFRFPFPYDQFQYQDSFSGTFLNITIWTLGPIVGAHFIVVRLVGGLCLPLISTESVKDDSDAAGPCIEITEIQDVTNRKLLQKENLDKRTLVALLNDTSLLNSTLKDAGIQTSGERIKIIMNLQTIERGNGEGNNLHNVRRPLGMETRVPTPVPGVQYVWGLDSGIAPAPDDESSRSDAVHAISSEFV
mmetsp:Transcript_31831/g.46522  ORF Transcript_31831/g.46522 Transcript_31831/m.46522 type:complete len:504 (-) Transcript_31831:103-1614(-)|eukprot:CAMPEP_0173059774 /NCGR_PEP_ID=MMETSP1102-20130122/2192_1 /TAXON_ID=49646 /ORGANISM="Geminigera sp., Strain Caron Lab Isolate" /LENGTH=503 /DNA_ID=CAMNT_0013925857 /DNA_START=92 /DNA_END=1603 /DNA_ORIENTATION=-